MCVRVISIIWNVNDRVGISIYRDFRVVEGNGEQILVEKQWKYSVAKHKPIVFF